jgi:ADP-ribose pyrophosphatase
MRRPDRGQAMSAADQGISADRWTAIPRTLCFITHADAVLLMRRAAHKRAFPGQYNGIGGHVERGEDPLSGALREIQEETGLTPAQLRDVRLRGITHIDAGERVGILLFVFSAVASTRIVTGDESEGSLHWVPLTEADQLPLVEDLPILLPRLFGPAAGAAPFFAHVRYDAHDRMMICFTEAQP